MKVTKEEKVSAKGRRFSVQRKMAVVARLLRGEPLELVARETNVTIQKLSEWRDRALAGATSALKERERDDRDDDIARLKAKVGEITMDCDNLGAAREPDPTHGLATCHFVDVSATGQRLAICRDVTS